MLEVQKKALYNLFRMTESLDALSEETSKKYFWKIEDLRKIPTEELFTRLQSFGVFLDQAQFFLVSEEFESSEELSAAFSEDLEDPEEADRLFLIVFELWRRLLPQRFTFSVFFDELDQVIFALDQGDTKAFFAVQGLLAELQSRLSELREQEKDTQKIFQEVSSYSTQDLEAFLYDFILEQLKKGDTVYASELLDGFEDYILDGKWFLLLRARLFSEKEKEKTIKVATKLLQRKEAVGDVSFLMEVMDLAVDLGSPFLFYHAFDASLPFLEEEADFQEVLGLGSALFCFLDDEKKEKIFEEVLEQRKNKKQNSRFLLHDTDILKIRPLFFDPSKKF